MPRRSSRSRWLESQAMDLAVASNESIETEVVSALAEEADEYEETVEVTIARVGGDGLGPLRRRSPSRPRSSALSRRRPTMPRRSSRSRWLESQAMDLAVASKESIETEVVSALVEEADDVDETVEVTIA